MTHALFSTLPTFSLYLISIQGSRWERTVGLVGKMLSRVRKGTCSSECPVPCSLLVLIPELSIGCLTYMLPLLMHALLCLSIRLLPPPSSLTPPKLPVPASSRVSVSDYVHPRSSPRLVQFDVARSTLRKRRLCVLGFLSTAE